MGKNSKEGKRRAQTDELTGLIRGATRPVVTIIFAAVIAQIVVEKIDAPEWFIGLAITVILWWFGDRTVRHVRKGEN